MAEEMTSQDRARQRKREHYLRNRDAYIQRAKARREADPEKHAEYVRNYYERNKEKVKARKIEALDKTPGARERARKITKEWCANNLERARELSRIGSANRRAKIRSVGGKLSHDITQKLMALQKGKCVCCRGALKFLGYHIDHVVPLALGGKNSDDNVQLLCPSCNSSKHAKHPVDFMQQRGYLL